MRNRFVLLFSCLVLLTSLVFLINPTSISNPVFEMEKPEPEPIPRDIMIVALGDSLTKGVGDSTKQGYVGYVREHLDARPLIDEVTVYNYGVRGDETEDLLNVLESEEILGNIEKADYILMTIGGNDLMNVIENNFFNLTIELFEKKEQAYKENLKKILSIIREHNDDAPLYYVGVFNPFSMYFTNIKEVKEIVFSWNEASRDVVSQFDHTVFVPTYDLFTNNPEDLFSDDNFHPNSRGYDLIGQRVLEYMN